MFLSGLSERPLDANQRANVNRLCRISDHFLTRAGIEGAGQSVVSEKTVILESGHQPNFFPHAGTFRKVFLLDQICKRLKKKGIPAVAFFGLADQNISTARLLSKNQIPDLNKNGFLKIGFRIRDEDRFRSFNRIQKPVPAEWDAEIEKIGQHYHRLFERTRCGDDPVRTWAAIRGILQDSYAQAQNFAELNSLIFVRVCQEFLGTGVSFFPYSAMHHESLFFEESMQILAHLSEFNRVYNHEITENNLDIPTVLPNHLPFWYECECGTKLDLCPDESGTGEVLCPGCSRHHTLQFGPRFENLREYYPRMDFSAVSRNIIMAQGLGVTLFLSGTGGSGVYGQVADRLASHLRCRRPVTLAWRSHDRYLGMMHRSALREVMRAFSLSPGDLFHDTFNNKIRQKLDEMVRNMEESVRLQDKAGVKYWKGQHGSASNLIEYTRKIFLNVPSFLDLLVNVPPGTIPGAWERAVSCAGVTQDGYLYRMYGDAQYPAPCFPGADPEKVASLYTLLQGTGVR